MRLKANVAALAFSKCRAKGISDPPATTWTAIGLRWRRVPRSRKLPSKRPLTTSAFHNWFPQFHLHFTAKVMASRPASRVSFSVATAMATASRRVREMLYPVLPMMTGVHRIEHSPRKSRLAGESPTARDGLSSGALTFTQAIGSQCIPRQTPQTFRGVVARRSRHLGEREVPGRLMGENGKRQLFEPMPREPLLTRRAGQKGKQGRRIDLLKDASPNTAIRPIAATLDRKSELVWRTRATSQTQGTTEATREDMVNSSPLLAQTSTPRAPAPGVPRSFTEGRPQGSMVLDPMLMERIAEDVIRRVERHVRIERERRGG